MISVWGDLSILAGCEVVETDCLDQELPTLQLWRLSRVTCSLVHSLSSPERFSIKNTGVKVHLSLCPFIDSTKGVQSRPSCTPSRSFQNPVPLWCPLDSWQSARSWTVCLLAHSGDMAGIGRCWPFLDVGTHTRPGKIRIKKSMKPLQGWWQWVCIHFKVYLSATFGRLRPSSIDRFLVAMLRAALDIL